MKYIRADSLHDFVATTLVEDMKSRKDIAEIFDKYNKENRELIILNNRLEGNKKAIERASYLYQQNPDDTIEKNLEKLTAERQKIKTKIEEAEKNAKILEIGNLNEISKVLKKTLIESEKLEVRNYIKSSIEEVVAGENDVTIKMKIN